MRKNFLVGIVASVSIASTLLAGSASASTPPNPKEKIAITAYVKTMAQASTTYLSLMRSSRNTVLALGKPAEAARRASVHSALAAFNSEVTKTKAPSLAAEKSYRSAVIKLKALPGDATLKANVKASLLALMKATAALKVDRTVATARAVFKKTRISAMVKFKAKLAPAIKFRTRTQIRAMAKFKASKGKALLTLKAALAAAKK